MTPDSLARRILSRLLLAVLVLAVGVRLGPKDRWIATGVVYYAAPWVMISLGFGVLALLLRRRVPFAATLLCLALWIQQSRGPGGSAPHADDILLRLWNAQGPKSNFEDLTLDILSDNPAMVFLTETAVYGKWADPHNTADVFGGRSLRYLGGGFTVMVTADYEILADRLVVFEGHSRFTIVDLRRRGGESFAVLLLDLDQNPLSAKEPLMRRVADAIVAHPLPVRLVLGDFNLPGDSIWFSKLDGYRSAFRVSGSGLEVSWPWPVPVLGLDQVWGDDTIAFRRSEYGPARGSDHRKLDVFVRMDKNPLGKGASPN